MSGPENTPCAQKADSLWSNVPDCFYEYKPDYFSRDLQAFDSAFRSKIHNFQIALSVKTNYLQSLLQDGLKAGAWLEATSEAEYETSLRAGAKPENIILNGPSMRAPFMTRALAEGALLQIDNLTQWDAVRDFANTHKDRAWKLALRINAAIPQEWSRFGLDLNDAKTMAAFTGEAIPNVEIIGFSFHHLTGDRSAVQYGEKVGLLGALWRKLFGKRPMSYLNIGGGFLSNAADSYRKQFNFVWTEFAQYAEEVAAALSRDSIFSNTKVVTEPGIAVMASALTLYTKIVAEKTIDGRTIMAAAGSVYDFKPTFHTKIPPFRIIRSARSNPSPRGGKTIVGSSCMEHDILLESFEGELSVGDYLIFDEVGAYTLVLRPSFIEPTPAVYLYEPSSNSWRCIRERGQLPG